MSPVQALTIGCRFTKNQLFVILAREFHAAMNITAQVDFHLTATELGVNAPRQVPYAAASMLTALAGDVRAAVQRQMPQVFDRPTDFTVRGVFTKGATRAKLESEVYFPESPDQAGKSKREYIRPGAQGAARRNQKKTEFLLTRIGALPAGWVTTPGKGATLDAHGNLAGSVYRQIINVLQIRPGQKPVAARSMKAAKKMGVAAVFFAVAPGANTLGKNGGWLPPGVWKHLPDRKISQILKFVKKASYTKRLDVKQIARDTIKAQAPARWRESAKSITERFARNGR